MQTISAVRVAHTLLEHQVKKARLLLDATAGNGEDTLFLARLSPADAHVYAFDIQQRALDETARKLEAAQLRSKVSLLLDDHARMDAYITGGIDVAVCNLGYLPGGDHAVTTVARTTLLALEKLVALLAPGGLAAITAYPGHEAGREEEACVRAFLEKLPAKTITACRYVMVNHARTAPVLYLVEKVRR